MATSRQIVSSLQCSDAATVWPLSSESLWTAGTDFVGATNRCDMRSVISAVVFASLAASVPVAAMAQAPGQPIRVAYTVEPFSPPSQITIQGAGVRLRAEPFTGKDTPILSSGNTGLPLNVI